MNICHFGLSGNFLISLVEAGVVASERAMMPSSTYDAMLKTVVDIAVLREQVLRIEEKISLCRHVALYIFSVRAPIPININRLG